MTADEVARVHALLTHPDPTVRRQGVVLAQSFDDWSAVTAGCAVAPDGVVCTPSGVVTAEVLELMFTGPRPAQVTALDLSRTAVDSVACLRPLTGLRHLNLLETAVSDVGPLAEFASLRTLDLTRCRALTDIAPLGGLTTLETLSLAGCRALQSVAVLTQLPQLTSLDLSFLDERLHDVETVSALTGLTRLHLANWYALESLECLSALTALTHLDLDECEGLETLDDLSGMESLRSLSLVSCSRLRSVQGVRGLSELTSLSVLFCRAIEDLETLDGHPHLCLADLRRMVEYPIH